MTPYKIFGIIFFTEMLSFLGFFYPAIETPLFLLITLSVLVLSLIDLRYGVLAALTELFIGGFGYLFVLDAGGLRLSIRMAIFVVILAASLFKIIKNRRIEFTKSKLFWPYIILIFFIIAGILTGYFRGNGLANVFFDSNAFLFLGYLLPLYDAFKTKEDLRLFRIIFWPSVFWISILTLASIYVFTHEFGFIPQFYKWIRDTRLGEISPAPGGFVRIFLQSQIYAVTGIILMVSMWLKGFQDKLTHSIAFCSILFSAVILSFSRSFWIGLAVSIIALFIISLSSGIIKALKAAGIATASASIGLVLILIAVFFPIPNRSSFSLFGMFGSRFSVSDPASSTRWAELKPLAIAIKQNPITGSGFGTSLAFNSSDPRILSKYPTNEYTTYAFEWGWLDIMLKIGLFGILAYLLVIVQIWRMGWKQALNGQIWPYRGIIMTILGLVVVNIFTPYLNHPLGLGWLMLVGLIFERNADVRTLNPSLPSTQK